MKQYILEKELNEQGLLELVDRGERHFKAQLDTLAERLLAEEGLRLIGLTGPTCSGKTTAAAMLTERLEAAGRELHIISIDDFYYNITYLKELGRKKGMDGPDYDSEDTIDMELLREAAASLLSERPTRLPHFNFHTGDREVGELLIPKKGDLFLFEGIQVLYPQVHEILAGPAYRSIYISPGSAVLAGRECFLPNDLRLMRRLVRDHLFRSTPPEFTLALWQSVRANEEQSIFPNRGSCDYHIDSTMPYEVGMLKPYLEGLLAKLPSGSPYAKAAKTVLGRLHGIQAVPAELLPKNSLYKEFIE